MNEHYYEKLMNIKTLGEQREFYQSLHYSRYEPTDYSALEILCEQYNFTAEDKVIDFGCGKGRLNFYINHFFDSTVTGIEMNTFFYKEAIDNKKNYLKKHKKKNDKINFLNCLAEEYKIKPTDNKFYFFNPFSVHIFINVIENILISVEEFKRTVDIILYYSSEEYIYFLNDNTPFELINEIKLPNLYDKNPRESFFVYRLT
jgi:Cyclopropane fatty acid synthase and related methyltransferases